MIKKFYNHSPRRYEKCTKEAFSHIWQYWKKAEKSYDGRPATKYHALCSVAIARPIGDEFTERTEWYNGHSHSVINFYSEIRIIDGSSIVDNSYCSLDISNYMGNPEVKNNAMRIDYTSNDSAMEFHKSEIQMFRLFKIIEQNFVDREFHHQIKKLLSNSLDEQRRI